MTGKRIGFDRFITAGWLDLVAGQVEMGAPVQQIRSILHKELESEIPSYEARMKTIRILLRVWVNVPEEHQALRAKALTLLPNLNHDDRLLVHWSMCLLAYPLFRDIAIQVAWLCSMYGGYEPIQLRKRVFQSWGDRVTLYRAIERIVQSMVDWEILLADEESGAYRLAPTRRLENIDAQLFAVEAVLSANESSWMALEQVLAPSEIFPFKPSLTVTDIKNSDRMQIHRTGGGEIAVGLRQ